MRSATSRSLLVAALALAGCADSELAAMEGSDCVESLELTVSPYAVTRGASTEIEVTWWVSLPLEEAVATLRVGEIEWVEVDVPLAAAIGDDAYELPYHGTLLNPFGLGAPSGSGRVLATADVIEGCPTAPSATSTFELR